MSDLAFTAVRTGSSRHDGWTAGRQLDFIVELAACGSVAQAARAVGMATASVYRLRKRPDARSFAAAWDAALRHARAEMYVRTLKRAFGCPVAPRFYRDNFTRLRVEPDVFEAGLRWPGQEVPK